MSKSATVETPLMKQYNAIKAKYPGALLLFRVGDFYETFGEDAIRASKILDIVLTKRANGAASHIELAGFPHHSLDVYLPKLVRAGNRVAICDQLEDPKMVKGIVKRGVTELVTPGLSLNDQVLDQGKNNFLCAVHLKDDQVGVAFLDISTGEFLVSQGTVSYVDKLMQGFQPSEVIMNKKERKEVALSFKIQTSQFELDEWIFQPDFAQQKLTTQFQVSTLKGFGVDTMPLGVVAAGAILHYLEATEHNKNTHINRISRIDGHQYMWLDRFTIRNLELLQPSQNDGTPLIAIMDETRTPMGSRLMRKWMVLPLKTKSEIEGRLETVEKLLLHPEKLDQLVQHLKQVGDLERLISKVATARINPREMAALARSLDQVPPISEVIEELGLPHSQLDPCTALVNRIRTHISDEPPLNPSHGNVIREGIDPQLDEYRKIAYSGKDFLREINEREVTRTGISSLKISYNKVFGYYLEVTNAHKDKVPADWIRKQTLVNAERYITEELKIYEEKILKAEDQIFTIELRLFQELVSFCMEYIQQVQGNARAIAHLDCLASFAIISNKYNYTRPVITEEFSLDIKAGRHPVIERSLPADESYIPNDIFLDSESQQIMIITGPNMAGKSALLRQTALITLMAQVGCFVPAGHARIGLVDKIFTRVGASDNLSRGESTFMVEMTETASILNNLSDRSLVLMDEIGRGTSTYDGISIAWSIVEFLHSHSGKPKTLFATHYHELNELTNEHPRVRNFNVSVKELGDKVIFLRKLQPGGSEHSFGIHVAQMAGMPNQIVIRANSILKFLEKEKLGVEERAKLTELPSAQFQLNLFESDPRMEKMLALLRSIDINAISPVEALLRLNEMQEILKRKT